MALVKISDWAASVVDAGMREGVREVVHEVLRNLFGG
jgi:hypothetical protein